MMLRRVLDLRAGDAVRPFDDRLWHVVEIKAPKSDRATLIVSHPVDGTIEVPVDAYDMVRLG